MFICCRPPVRTRRIRSLLLLFLDLIDQRMWMQLLIIRLLPSAYPSKLCIPAKQNKFSKKLLWERVYLTSLFVAEGL